MEKQFGRWRLDAAKFMAATIWCIFAVPSWPLFGSSSPLDISGIFHGDRVGLTPKDADVIEYIRLPSLDWWPTAAVRSTFDRAHLQPCVKLPSEQFPPLPYFDFNHVFADKMARGLFIIDFRIVVAQATSVAIFSDGRRFYEISADGNRLPLCTSHKWLEHYASVERLDLHQGLNRIEVKVLGQRGECAFSLEVTSLETAKSIAGENWIDNNLDKYVYAKNDLLAVNQHSIHGRFLGYRLAPTAKGEQAGPTFEIERRLEKTGINTVVLESKTDSVAEKIVVVDSGAIGAMEASILGDGSLDGRSLSEALILVDRIKYLSTDKRRRPEKLMGERDLVGMIDELCRLSRRVKTKRDEDWLACPGRHFAAYRSPSLGVMMPYMVYIPTAYHIEDQEKLVIVYPSLSPSKANRFVESYFVDLADLVESYVQAAEEHKFIVIWPSGEHLSNTPMAERDVLECARAARMRFEKHGRQVDVIGSCGSGRDALVFAARHAGDFGAVAAFEITLEGDAAASPKIGKANAMTTPLEFLDELAKMSVFLSHGDLDRHVPDGTSIMLGCAIRAAGGSPIVRIISGADESFCPIRNNQWIFESFDFFDISHGVPGK